MRYTPARLSWISGAALGGAMIWGAIEFVALQWSRVSERFRMLGMFQTH